MNGNQIRRLRTKLDLTQVQFGLVIGGANGITISRWENGHHVPAGFYATQLKLVKEIAKSERRVRALLRRHGLI